jgi:hypothetical protein
MNDQERQIDSKNARDGNPPAAGRLKSRYLLAALLVGAGMAAALLLLYLRLIDFRCVSLLAHSAGEAYISLPAGCIETTNAPSDSVVEYLRNDSSGRGFLLRRWIMCDDAIQASKVRFVFEQDPRWLPSYVPDGYQFRRTVVVFPHSKPVPEASRVAAAVGLVPWRRYVLQVGGQCATKLSVWK